jgi:initiation factor 1A
MVKNDGGNKGKGLARKHVNAAKCGGSNKQLRVAVEDGERYAVVSKMLGNGMCYVRLLDGSAGDRLCIIRNKFKGRGKRDNILDSGSWVLVGMREWSSKQDTCDLLEVYNHGERDRLMKNEPCFKSVTAECDADSSSSSSANAHSTVQFADSATLKYSNMVKGQDDDDSDGEVMQQRAYDMPTSSDDDDDDEDDETPALATPTAALKPNPNPNPKLKVDHINVDDI